MKTNDFKLLLGEAFTDYSPDVIEVKSEPDISGQTRINALTLEVVAAYWLYRALWITE